MEETVADKIITILQKDAFNQEFINNLTLDEKINLMNENFYSNSAILLEVARNIKKKKLILFSDEELFQILSKVNIKYLSFGQKELLLDNCSGISILKILEIYKASEVKNMFECSEININCSAEEFKKIKKKIMDFNTISKESKDELISQILWRVKSDEVKAKYFAFVNKDSKNQIAISIEKDEVKEQIINMLYCSPFVIESFKSDEYKEKFLKKFWLQYSRTDKYEIIASFSNPELRNKYIEDLKTNGQIIDYLSVYGGDIEDRKKIIKSVKSEKLIMEIFMEDFNLSDEIYEIMLKKIKSKGKLLEILRTRNDLIYILFKMDTSFLTEDDIYQLLVLCNDPDTVLKNLTRVSNKNSVKIIINYGVFTYNLKNYGLIDGIIKTEYKSEYDDAIKYICDSFELDYNRMQKLINTFGITIIGYLNEKNILKLFDFTDKEFNNFIKIFDKKYQELNKNTVNDIVGLILQRNFFENNDEIIHIYHATKNYIDHKEFDIALLYVAKVYKESSLKDYLEKKNITINAFCGELFALNKEALEIYHKYTYEYILNERNKYVKENVVNISRSLMNSIPDSNKIIKTIFKNEETNIIYRAIKTSSIKKLNEEELEIFNNDELLKKLIIFKKSPQNENIPLDIKPYLKVFSSLLKKCTENGCFNEIGWNPFYVTYDYEPKKQDNNKAISIALDLNMELMQKGILNSDEDVEELIKYLDKFKLIGWGDTFDEFIANSNIIIDNEIIEYFIMYFGEINNLLKKEKKDNSALLNLFDHACGYIPFYEKYLNLIKEDDFKFYIANPKPNASSLNKKERLKELETLIKQMYERKIISIPPLEEEINLGEKNIQVGVCDPTDSIILTLGERTGSCMRMGGIADSLFKFCLNDKNGFHIVFKDPITGNFISRVSGFRNGNTIFLNQLRESCDSKYSNFDVREALKKYCQDLIIKSENSEYPICNVVITKSYAMNDAFSSQSILLPRNIERGLVSNDEQFYNDIEISECKLVATSNPDGTLVPVKFERDTSEYPVSRSKAVYKENEELNKLISMLECRNFVINGGSLEDFAPSDHHFIKGYVGVDFYVGVMEDGLIVKWVMDSRHQNLEILNEIEKIESEILDETRKNL